MSTNTTNQIESTVQSFVAEITGLVRVAALGAVAAALGGDAPARRGPGRPRGSGVRRGPGRPKGSGTKPGRPARAGKRIRRSAEDLNAIAGKFLSFVKANDGKRIEEISKGLGIASSELQRPAQMLLAAKAVKTTGKKRGTRYHAGRGGRGAVPKAGKRAKNAARQAKSRAAKRERKAMAARPSMTAAPEAGAA